ncbi:MAG TPA: STAS domain-containing protein [Miltoncostaeaceae bacterium]|nr:STAS domain-containing protein [Miltoncostaeaceae bacterium]
MSDPDDTDERLHPRGLLKGRLVGARGGVVYAVSGDLDQASAGALTRRLLALAATDGDVVLDVSGVAFIDSVGLEVLIRMHRLLAAEGRRLVLREPAPPLARLLELTMLERTFAVEGSAIF